MGSNALTLVRLSGRDVDAQDGAVSITNEVDLGAEAAARASERMVMWLLELRPLAAAQSSRAADRFFPPPAAALLARMTERVDTPKVVIDPALVVQFVQQRGDDAGPSAIRRHWLNRVKTVCQGP